MVQNFKIFAWESQIVLDITSSTPRRCCFNFPKMSHTEMESTNYHHTEKKPLVAAKIMLIRKHYECTEECIIFIQFKDSSKTKFSCISKVIHEIFREYETSHVRINHLSFRWDLSKEHRNILNILGSFTVSTLWQQFSHNG